MKAVYVKSVLVVIPGGPSLPVRHALGPGWPLDP